MRYVFIALIGLRLGCGEPAPEPPAAPEGPRPSEITNRPLAASDVERIRQILSELDAVETPEGILITLPERVLFDFDQYTLRPDARTTLDRVAEVVRHYGSAPVQITGHTDGKGTDEYNQTLSDRRAEAVAGYLAASPGIDRGRLTARGMGETSPVAPNEHPDGSDNPEGRRQNRRVEIVIGATTG